MEEENRMMTIFIDFKRAFETVDREILLKKLYMYGVTHIELKWFKSYLQNRKQTAKLNNTVYVEVINNFGVPQGSILGALLFIIYIRHEENIRKMQSYYTLVTPLYTQWQKVNGMPE